MRKLFNYALLAAALLVGVNVNAADVAEYNGQKYESVEAAFAAATNGGTIKVIAQGVQVNQAASIVLNAEKTWTLDLNGHDLVYNNPAAASMQEGSMFQLYKGILRVKNGNVINATPVKTGSFNATGGGSLRCFFVCGEAGKTKSTDMSAYKTQLYVEEGVFVDCTYGKDAVEVYDYCGGEATHKNAAFGVYIELEGKMHGEKYGIQMSGQVSAVPAEGENPAEYNFPKYVVKKNAEVYANPTLYKEGGCGIYLGGYCFADVQGYVHGSTGMYIKNGIVNIEDAVIASDYTGDFVPGGSSKSSTEGAGTAIVIVSSGLTYGETQVTIGGDTKVTSQVGYAIEETVHTNDQGTKVGGVNINGGTFEGGEKGGVVFSSSTDTQGKVHIIDGNFTDDDVTKYISEGNATIVDDGQGNQTVVVSQKPTVTGDTIKNTTIAAQEYLVWDAPAMTQTMESGKTTVKFFDMKAGSVTIKAGATFEITDKLVMGGAARIVVEPGATLISSGNKGIVAASVDNITIQTDETVGYGQFLFNPAVNSNKNTNATVQLIANSFTKKDQDGVTTEYLKQRFGIPTHNTLKKITATKSASDMTPVRVAFQRYDVNGWLTLGFINGGTPLNYEEMAEPFRYYMLQCGNEDVKSLITFSGEMTSNANFTIKIVPGWNTFANSYSGNMFATDMLKTLLEQGLDATVWVAEQSLGTTWAGFRSFNLTQVEFDETLDVVPMQAFILKNTGSEVAQYTLNYNDFVWKNRPGAPKAPRFAPALSNKTMAKINVLKNEQNIDAVYMLQADEFTSDVENGYDAEKYMNENVNFYVNGADMKQTTLATNVLEGTYLGFAAKEAGVYTLSFDKIAGNDLVLVDLVNGQEINMTEGAQYNFVVEANYSNDYRFMVKNAAKAPTAMDKVDAKANAAKVISGGEFRIVKNGRAYNAMGAEL